MPLTSHITPGCEVILTDALSHYQMNITINHVQLSKECENTMQNATATDPELSALAQLIIDGWPEHIQDVPQNLQKYHPVPPS